MNNLRILGISGSLREGSTNSIILKTLAKLLPVETEFILYNELHLIPPFNPGDDENQVVKTFKAQIAQSHAIILCTPEYAFGVPGVLKNALDWTVSTGEFNDKPVAVISASPLNSGGDKALASLLLTLTALGTKRNEESALAIANVKSKILPDGTIAHAQTMQHLQDQIDNLVKIIGI
jgi:chromate reductase